MLVDLIRTFLVYKMTNTFHHNQLLQKRHMLLETALVYEVLRAWSMIGQVEVTNDELNWNFYLSPSPWGGEFPISAPERNKEGRETAISTPTNKWEQPLIFRHQREQYAVYILGLHLLSISTTLKVVCIWGYQVSPSCKYCLKKKFKPPEYSIVGASTLRSYNSNLPNSRSINPTLM